MTDAAAGVVDLHTHLMPGVDDGAADGAEARRAIEALAGQGVEAAVATPHLTAGLAEADPDRWDERLAELDDAWGVLKRAGGVAVPGLRLERGVELKLDAPPPSLSDGRLRLAGTRFVSVEFASLAVPPFGADQLESVRRAGATPVLAHPERYAGLADRLEVAATWRETDALLQVNAGSIVGQYGNGPQRAAWALLERGWVDVIASDFHARGEPAVSRARRVLADVADEGQDELLLTSNPKRVLDDRLPRSVPPLDSPGFWSRLRSVVEGHGISSGL